MKREKATGIPWPITIVAVVVGAGCGMIIIIYRDFPWEKLPPDSGPFSVPEMFIHGLPLTMMCAALAGLLGWIIERKLRARRRAA